MIPDRATPAGRSEYQRVRGELGEILGTLLEGPDELTTDLVAMLDEFSVGWILYRINHHHPAPPQQNPAVSATLKGTNMPGQITVDTTNETVTLEWVDDHGDADATAPDGAVVTFSSDNPAVATVTTDPSNSLQGDVSLVAEGQANLSATIADASGNPILEPDGVTPFSVAPVQVTVSAGAADSAQLVLSV